MLAPKTGVEEEEPTLYPMNARSEPRCEDLPSDRP